MRKPLEILACVFLGCSQLSAQPPDASAEEKMWDASATVALMEVRPDGRGTPYRDDWYARGRYAGAIGLYWTRHLKTEIEYSSSAEGSVYVQDFVLVDGQPFPYSLESFHRLQQGSLRMVWQFRDNAWVHPYLSAGVVVEADRRRTHVPLQYQPVSRVHDLVVQHANRLAHQGTRVRGGVTGGGGAKFYLSPNAFFNSGAIVTFSKPAATISLLAGFGVDF